ncbi:uncharacterized protein LOC130623689 [Hydractinia symbiolongicarpus]|uniref:uncharacterized protein LOC130623689 n=1 Tax=Hydractinia symbiolongicarpus TaxID=13093 RepID=UPI00254DF612|nr:uncharacterized protein LOC130623689 [Hydractinia symbiolongicarpus]
MKIRLKSGSIFDDNEFISVDPVSSSTSSNVLHKEFCMFQEVGCRFMGTSMEIQTHCDQHQEVHLQLALEQAAENKKINKQLQALEETNSKLSGDLTAMKRKLEASEQIQTEVKDLQEQLELRLRQISLKQQRIQSLEKDLEFFKNKLQNSIASNSVLAAEKNEMQDKIQDLKKELKRNAMDCVRLENESETWLKQAGLSIFHNNGHTAMASGRNLVIESNGWLQNIFFEHNQLKIQNSELRVQLHNSMHFHGKELESVKQSLMATQYLLSQKEEELRKAKEMNFKQTVSIISKEATIVELNKENTNLISDLTQFHS